MSEAYSAVYTVSDLHLGGAEGFQMFDRRQSGALAGALRSLAARHDDPARPALFVLNGDIIDTLAERPFQFLHVDDAVAVLDRIARDPTFEDIFRAFGDVAAAKGATLCVAIGNHDLELAFPEVQDQFRTRCTEHLGRGAAAARAHIRFQEPGRAVTVRVGGRRVYISHGNEVDRWNIVDLDALAEAIDVRAFGRSYPKDAWVPNAGTRLVTTVMNPVKERWPFVDLLKPEREVAVPLVLALDKSVLRYLDDLVPVVARHARSNERRLDESSGGSNTEGEELFAAAVARARGGLAQDPRELIERADDSIWGDEETADEGEDGRLDFTAMSLAALAVGGIRRGMRDWTKGDDPFGPDQRGDLDQKVIARLGPAVDILICGHTHMARSQEIEGTGQVYINTGTWARLMHLTAQDVAHDKTWARVEEAIRAHSMAALDNAILPARDQLPERPLVVTRGFVSVVEEVNGRVAARLWRAGTDFETRDATDLSKTHWLEVRS